ncbi:DUF7388 family protein [Halomicrobium katesii]|uniref:DUF7388 family protein n=1 Tax=Halomicrobium katesii TaxID=437163 RepID=UPI00047799A0|nr:luciferase [Halomicrobium katesii]
MLTGVTLDDVGIDAAALKPAEVDVTAASDLDVSTVTIDYEGREHLPDRSTLAALADRKRVRLTTPVRADGFDPLGDDGALATLPDGVGRVLVAGHDAYLTSDEAERAIVPRLEAAAATATDPWVGTEGIERVALAIGGTQFELLSRSTGRDLRALRTAGFEGAIAVYAPTVLTDDEGEILDAVGDYAARRGPVRAALPDGAATDATASGRARDVLARAVRDYALVGEPETVAERIEQLRAAGADAIVGYPARGIEPVR